MQQFYDWFATGWPGLVFVVVALALWRYWWNKLGPVPQRDMDSIYGPIARWSRARLLEEVISLDEQLDEAIYTAWDHGAQEWVRETYPDEYKRLMARDEVARRLDTLGQSQPLERPKP